MFTIALLLALCGVLLARGSFGLWAVNKPFNQLKRNLALPFKSGLPALDYAVLNVQMPDV